MSGLEDQGLVTKKFAARFLAVSIRTIDRLVSEGELCAVKVIRSTRIPAAALQDYINRHTLKPKEWTL